MAKSGIANVVGRAEEVRSQHRHRHQHHHQHQHRHHHRHQHQPTLLLISVPLLRPGRVITRVRQLWRWYFQNVDTLIGIATSHDQLRQARPDQWPEWSPSHPALHTALLLRCTGARVKMISSSRVTAWQQPRDQTRPDTLHGADTQCLGKGVILCHINIELTFTLLYCTCAHAQPPAKPNLQGCSTFNSIHSHCANSLCVANEMWSWRRTVIERMFLDIYS